VPAWPASLARRLRQCAISRSPASSSLAVDLLLPTVTAARQKAEMFYRVFGYSRWGFFLFHFDDRIVAAGRAINPNMKTSSVRVEQRARPFSCLGVARSDMEN
jgi:hypothetical protein